ncbi:MAG: hypothetical protein LRY51_08615 [Geovibrio sp.]|nr:hypothetical protein [Geovibrio sp.]
MGVQPNKAVVGKNAFAHEAGIHQDGVLKNRITYEIMTPESVGYPSNALVLGKHSGRHAFIKRLEALGFTLDAEQTETAFNKFKVLADKKKEVFDEDLEMLVEQQLNESVKHFSVGTVTFASGNAGIPTATVELKNEQGEVMVDASIGDGPVDACLKAIERTTGIVGRLKSYKINALTAGKDAQGEVVLTVEFEKCGYDVTGRGSNTDVVVASAEAYVYAMNRYLSRKDHKKEMEDKGI